MVPVLKWLAGLAFTVLLVVPATAQSCNGQFSAGTICGNPTGSTQPPSANATIFSMINQNCSSPGQGSVPYLGSGGLGCLAPGTSGLPFLSGGTGANPAYGILGLAAGGLGGSQSAATSGQVPVFPGSIGAAVPTTITPAIIGSLGTGVATALGINVGTAGSFVVNGGVLGTPSSGTATNLTGTASGLTAGNVTTNANLTGPITSIGNATSIASQTGTGSKFVVDSGPTISSLTVNTGFTATGLVTNADLAGSIAASKLVGTDIATVGTITAGTWHGTAIDLTRGGLGASQAAATANEIPVYPGSGGAAVPTYLNLYINPSSGGLIFDGSTYYPSFRGSVGNIAAAIEPLTNSLNNVIFFGSGTGPGGVGTAITSRRQNGTDVSPTATLNGDELFFLQSYAYDGTSFSQTVPPAVVISATEDWNTGAHGSSVMFQGVPNGTVAGQVEASLGNGLVLQNTGVSAIQGNGRGTLAVQSTTASSSTTTGAAVIAGGLGVGGALFGTSASFSTSLKLAGVLGWSATAPTIASGFCSTGSPVTTVDANNGTAAFDILIGAATCGSTGTLTMPAATTGWVCSATDVTTPASHNVVQTGTQGSTTAVVLTDYARTTGIAQNFNPADHIHVMCTAY